ncbi:WYL domain-containing protein [Paenalkalicoccus suaedae]|uniref:WYL domain-containing protein n=1 Tax=Paenalkalicoccus suaedae TaxID=2592382 RepID=A0A859FDR1_9BACI|nr:WYL domain-containing protein [Paenalkalicoccus suaedae]QKS70366.1 WYL domain-containing protein [Paenalkalicoccus suaedae]
MKPTNRRRLLMLLEVLHTHSDEDHTYTVRELASLIEETYDVVISTAALKQDLLELIGWEEAGIEECYEQNGLPKRYYKATRILDQYDVRILMDAISSATFLTQSRTENLLKQLSRLISVHHMEGLKAQVSKSSYKKSLNNGVRYHISTIYDALSNNKMVRFRYETYHHSTTRTLKRDGGWYKASPLGVYWHKERYYFIAIESNVTKHFRIDRMVNVEMTEECFKRDPHFSVEKYVENRINMFSGKKQSIELSFASEWIRIVIDQFGTQADIRKHGDGSYHLYAESVVGKGLVRWILSNGANIKVIHPVKLRDMVQSEINKMNLHYT